MYYDDKVSFGISWRRKVTPVIFQKSSAEACEHHHHPPSQGRTISPLQSSPDSEKSLTAGGLLLLRSVGYNVHREAARRVSKKRVAWSTWITPRTKTNLSGTACRRFPPPPVNDHHRGPSSRSIRTSGTEPLYLCGAVCRSKRRLPQI